MNSAEELCHSSGPWKKHKYFQKIGEGANAVYKYAKNDAVDDSKDFYKKHVTGDEYKGRELAAKENAKYDQHLAENAAKEGRTEAANRGLKESERYGRMAAKAEHDYYTKSLKGISENAAGNVKRSVGNAGHTVRSVANDSVSRGQRLIDSILHPKTTVSVTSNLMPAGTKKTIKK